MSLRYADERPARAALLSLYEAVGWDAYLRDPDALERAVDGSNHVVTAWNGLELVGLARTITDGVSVWFLQDLLVRPSHQRRGIGGELVARCVARHADVARGVLLTDAAGPVEFYEDAGWRRDPRLATFVRGA